MRNDLLLKKIGTKIKSERKAKKMTLQQLSDLCDINISSLWFIEEGRRNLHILTLKGIADVLKMDIKDFI